VGPSLMIGLEVLSSLQALPSSPHSRWDNPAHALSSAENHLLRGWRMRTHERLLTRKFRLGPERPELAGCGLMT
jgi:hypothetical protein